MAERGYRILSLDGGGTWALIQVRALMRVFEKKLGRVPGGHEVLSCFDLVVANSGGSIVAGALACDMPLEEIRDVFENETARREIFHAKLPEALGRMLPIPRYPTSEKYDALRAHLVGKFPATEPLARWREKTPKEPRLADLVIVGFDYDTERATFFRTNRESRAGSMTSAAPAGATLLDAVHASTNAPVLYFDGPTRVTTDGGERRYWDGAIGGYNNPAMVGVVEAVANRADAPIRVLSIGTGTVRKPRRPGASREGDDRLFVGGASPSLVGDMKKLAASILDDPPDAASFVAHVMLGGRLPADPNDVVGDGRLVRMNPVIRPRCVDTKWEWPPAFSPTAWAALADLDMDAVEDEDVKKVVALCERWLAGDGPNQPIRANDVLEAEIGHDTYAAAEAAALTWL